MPPIGGAFYIRGGGGKAILTRSFDLVIPGRRVSGEPGIQTALRPALQAGFRVRAKTRAPD
jgi:hypothetical protein